MDFGPHVNTSGAVHVLPLLHPDTLLRSDVPTHRNAQVDSEHLILSEVEHRGSGRGVAARPTKNRLLFLFWKGCHTVTWHPILSLRCFF